LADLILQERRGHNCLCRVEIRTPEPVQVSKLAREAAARQTFCD
jgi:hypothetical protein